MNLPAESITVAGFIAAFQAGEEALLQAGLIYVALLEQNPKVADQIIEQYPALSRGALSRLERIGRGQYFHRLEFVSGPGVSALRKCPLSEQVRYFSEPIPVLEPGGQEGNHRLIPVNELTREQAAQAFNGNRLRSLSEQRSWLAKTPRLAPVEIQEPYVLGRGKITFREPVTLTAAQLANLLSQIA